MPSSHASCNSVDPCQVPMIYKQTAPLSESVKNSNTTLASNASISDMQHVRRHDSTFCKSGAAASSLLIRSCAERAPLAKRASITDRKLSRSTELVAPGASVRAASPACRRVYSQEMT